jgi:hypothetical protein
LANKRRAGQSAPLEQPLWDHRTLRFVVWCVFLTGLWIGSRWIRYDSEFRGVKGTVLYDGGHDEYRQLLEKIVLKANADGAMLNKKAESNPYIALRQVDSRLNGCRPKYAFLPDGLNYGGRVGVQFLARLPAKHSIFFLGRRADEITSLQDLRSKRIGIGPQNSETARVMKDIFGAQGMKEFDFTLQHHSVAEQMSYLRRGDLEVGVFMASQNSTYIKEAMTTYRLKMASLREVPALAQRIGRFREGVLVGGYYDPVNYIPAGDRRIVQLDTVLVGSQCLSRANIEGIMSLLAQYVPDFRQANLMHGPPFGLPASSVARDWINVGERFYIDKWLPWIPQWWSIDLSLHVFMACAVFLLMVMRWYRYRLSRLHGNRLYLERETEMLLGRRFRWVQVAEFEAEAKHREAVCIARLEALIQAFGNLLHRCRQEGRSWWIPLGRERDFQLEEEAIYMRLDGLSKFRRRL